MRRTHISLTIFFCAFLSLFCFPLPAGSTVGATRISYDVLTRGFHIGKAVSSLQVSNEAGQKVVHFTNKTDVNISLLWMGCNISSSELATLKDGNLVSYSRREKKKGADVAITGRLEDRNFSFDVAENGRKRAIVIPRSSYDHTSMECPEAKMEFKPGAWKTVRILDAEFAEVVERSYRLVREDTYEIDGRTYHCRVIDFKDPHKSCRRWIGIDHGAVIVFRQDGKGRDGSYSVQAATLEQI